MSRVSHKSGLAIKNSWRE